MLTKSICRECNIRDKLHWDIYDEMNWDDFHEVFCPALARIKIYWIPDECDYYLEQMMSSQDQDIRSLEDISIKLNE